MSVYITEFQIDTLKEVLNIGVGRAASLLSEMVNLPVSLSIPEIEIVDTTEVHQKLDPSAQKIYRIVSLRIEKGYSGYASLVFSNDHSNILINALVGQADLETKNDVYLEVGNVILNSVLGTFANLLGTEIVFNPPMLTEGELNKVNSNFNLKMSGNHTFICQTKMEIDLQSKINGIIMLIFSVRSIEDIKRQIDEFIGSSGI